MSTIRAHFDGNVFVPDDPVDCAKGSSVRLVVLEEANDARPLKELAEIAGLFPTDSTWPSDGAAQIDHYLYGTSKTE